LVISPLSGLPSGAKFNGEQGNFDWTPHYEQAGEYELKFQVADPLGAKDNVTVRVRIDNVNRSPSLSVSSHEVILGETLNFFLLGKDPDQNTSLTYSAVGLPEGATLDAVTGEFNWVPSPGQLADYPVTFRVSDGSATASKTGLLRAVLRPAPLPVTIELTPSFPTAPDRPILIHATADSLAEIVSVELVVEGQSLAIDEKGRGKFIPEAPGRYEVVATATDADGRVGQQVQILKVRDPEDVLAPVVKFGEGLLNGLQLRKAQAIVGTIADTNLDEWQLELIPFGEDSTVTLATGYQSLSDAALFQLDPESLRNGIYQLRLTATDMSGRTRTTAVLIEVNSQGKTAQYEQQQTDLTVNFDGTTLDLIRSYDVLNRDRAGSFGYGWRLAGADPHIQTHVTPTGQEHLGIYTPFEAGTRLFLTLPSGDRQGFTFQPQLQQLPGLDHYIPAWVADPGIDFTLKSVSALLTKAGDRFYELKTGNPYNPASGLLGAVAYQLTAPDGTVYEYSKTDGLLAQITPEGRRLTFSDGGIISDSGEVVLFERDEFKRLTRIIAPDGQEVRYGYDEQGNLATVRDLASGNASRYGYDADGEHWLTLVAGVVGQDGTVITYGLDTPQTAPIVADLGTAYGFSRESTQGSLGVSGRDFWQGFLYVYCAGVGVTRNRNGGCVNGARGAGESRQ
jgi:YD repeat-containing protein